MSNKEIFCTLCGNQCPMYALGCIKGRRFYEDSVEPYCTLCENHCMLTNLKCRKGVEFYGTDVDLDTKYKAPLHMPKLVSDNLINIFEQATHQFIRCRGGNTSQMKVLRFLMHHGSVTQREIQRALNIGSAAMSEIVTKLESKDLIMRTQDEQDKRRKMIQLTVDGEALFQQQSKREGMLNLFAPLTETEQEELKKMLKKLNECWLTIDLMPERTFDPFAEAAEP